MRFVDLFSGCGGLSRGLIDAGFEARFATDNDSSAGRTYSTNFPTADFFGGDVRDFLTRFKRGKMAQSFSEIDLVCGGPPCQGFSEFNPFRSSDDERNDLLSYFLEFAFQVSPRFILIENVPGILSMSDGDVARRILETLERFGYQAHLWVLQAGGYGCPQNRWRVFFVGTKSRSCPSSNDLRQLAA